MLAMGFEASRTEAPRHPVRCDPDQLCGDLIVCFSARACATRRGQHALINLPTIPLIPSVLLLGPRPRPLPLVHTCDSIGRSNRLREELASLLCRFILPQARKRCSLASEQHVLLVTLGGSSMESISSIESAELCATLVSAIMSISVRRIWLPLHVGLLDEEALALETAALVILHASLPSQVSE